MNLHHLKIFLTVARTGSISAGAERLHISQPAVTREIRELESNLALQLFDRYPRGVQLTEAGRRLEQFAERIFALEKAAERDMRDFANLGQGELLLAASATLASYWLPDLINQFRQHHPHVSIDLQISNTREVTEQLDDGRIALGFVEGAFERSSYAHLLLAYDQLIPTASPNHPLAQHTQLRAEQLQSYDLYMRESGSGARASIEHAYEQHGLQARPCLSVGGIEVLKRVVAGGQGIAWLSQLAIQDELASGKLCQLDVYDLKIQRELFVLWRHNSHLSPAPSAFLEQLKSNIKIF